MVITVLENVRFSNTGRFRRCEAVFLIYGGESMTEKELKIEVKGAQFCHLRHIKRDLEWFRKDIQDEDTKADIDKMLSILEDIFLRWAKSDDAL